MLLGLSNYVIFGLKSTCGVTMAGLSEADPLQPDHQKFQAALQYVNSSLSRLPAPCSNDVGKSLP